MAEPQRGRRRIPCNLHLAILFWLVVNLGSPSDQH
jgi:hypothetical protein